MNAFLKQTRVFLRTTAALSLVAGIGAGMAIAQAAQDTLVLSNGDTLHGKLVTEIGGTVTFHTDDLGDVKVPWAKIKELHSNQKFAIIPKGVELQGKKRVRQVPVGTVDVKDNALTVTGTNTPAEPVPLANAAYIVDEATVNKLLNSEPGFFQAWNGSATAGATIVAASTNQYTVSGAVGLIRVVPSVPWLNPRNRTAVDFSGSYGKITQPAYVIPATPGPPPTPATPVAASTLKTAILHADGERDEYFSPRVYALVNVAFDHNYSQSLDLQQIYGGGIGVTAIKDPKQELDLKATIQYERQSFMASAAGPATQDNLIGTTFGASYVAKLKLVTYTQGLAYLPAWNDMHAYSANETNTLTFPAWKNFGFTVGTLDSYINNPPVSAPPTKANSFQFTMGLTYAIKSKY
jgi:hypothetical protein